MYIYTQGRESVCEREKRDSEMNTDTHALTVALPGANVLRKPELGGVLLAALH